MLKIAICTSKIQTAPAQERNIGRRKFLLMRCWGRWIIGFRKNYRMRSKIGKIPEMNRSLIWPKQKLLSSKIHKKEITTINWVGKTDSANKAKKEDKICKEEMKAGILTILVTEKNNSKRVMIITKVIEVR